MQPAQEPPQPPLFFAFLFDFTRFLIRNTTITAIIEITNPFPQLAEIKSNIIYLTLTFLVSFVASLYGLKSMKSSPIRTSAATINPTMLLPLPLIIVPN